MNRSTPCYELVESPFGEAAIVWAGDAGPFPRHPGLPPSPRRRGPERDPGEVPRSGKKIRYEAREGYSCLYGGKDGLLRYRRARPEPVPPFHRKVLRALTNIPRGKVSTYGALAGRTGAPGGARAAGQGCARNPFPLIFPCHRVIRSDGSLGGFGGGLKLKRALLEMEGVRFDKNGQVEPEFILQ